jgi:hypothetical protein
MIGIIMHFNFWYDVGKTFEGKQLVVLRLDQKKWITFEEKEDVECSILSR